VILPPQPSHTAASALEHGLAAVGPIASLSFSIPRCPSQLLAETDFRVRYESDDLAFWGYDNYNYSLQEKQYTNKYKNTEHTKEKTKRTKN
jgi:hypothetical protein